MSQTFSTGGNSGIQAGQFNTYLDVIYLAACVAPKPVYTVQHVQYYLCVP